MGSSKTVFHRLMPRRAVRRAEESSVPGTKPGTETEAAQHLNMPVADHQSEPDRPKPSVAERTWREIFATVIAIIREDARPPGHPASAKTAAEMQASRTEPVIRRPRSKAERGNLLVMIILGCDTLFGVAIGLIGFFGLENDGVALLGATLATGGILLMLFFQLVGRER
jgi:hypothetical protein